MKFGDNLNRVRKIRKISQEELADKLGVSRQSISKWETGENYPSMTNIMCLCTIFKCNINGLVHEDMTDINLLDEEVKMNVVKFKNEKQKEEYYKLYKENVLSANELNEIRKILISLYENKDIKNSLDKEK